MTETGNGPGRHRRTCLVVEDEDELLAYLADLLASNDYLVTRARNGVEAMVALATPTNHIPDVVLLDLGLPLESGVSVLSFLRNVLQSGAPVVVLTGHNDPDEEAATTELGVSAYLRKPAGAEELLRAIEEALL